MTVFRVIVAKVRRLQPGQAVQFDPDDLAFESEAPPGWTDAEWVLECITGSAYEYSFREIPETRRVQFMRERKPVAGHLRTYVSPDRRHHFDQLPNGLWRVKP